MKQSDLKTPPFRFVSNKLGALKPIPPLPKPQAMPNREVISALDSALNRIDSDLRRWAGRGNGADFLEDLKRERKAIVVARNFVIDKRKDRP